MAELAFKPSDRWRVHAKYTYDVNHADNGADLIVAQGTELSMAGAGVEFYPAYEEAPSSASACRMLLFVGCQRQCRQSDAEQDTLRERRPHMGHESLNIKRKQELIKITDTMIINDNEAAQAQVEVAPVKRKNGVLKRYEGVICLLVVFRTFLLSR